MLITRVAGAQPGFMKAPPVLEPLTGHGRVSQVLVHMGQKYDAYLSAVFFQRLGMPQPNINLEGGRTGARISQDLACLRQLTGPRQSRKGSIAKLERVLQRPAYRLLPEQTSPMVKEVYYAYPLRSSTSREPELRVMRRFIRMGRSDI